MDFFSFGSPDIATFPSDNGPGILVPGSQNSSNDPFAGLNLPSGIWSPSSASSTTSSSSGSSDAQSWLKTLFPWANLGTQAFLADKAINNGSQLSFSTTGTPIVGAAAQSLSSILPLILIVVVLIIIFSVLKK
jgi:hypothetical protein